MKHRATISAPDVMALDLLAEQLNYRPAPRRAARKHVDTTMPLDASRTNARCTGGLTNAYGVRLIKCRSAMCPKHNPEAYAEHMARHTPESF